MELFIGPWNQAANWSVSGVAGTHRFLQRVWVLTQEFMDSEGEAKAESEDIRRVVHKAVKKVSEDLRDLSFNTAIAAQMELVNELYRLKAGDGYASRDWPWALRVMLQLLAPFAPHISEELWQQLGCEGSIHTSDCPHHDEKYLTEDTITVVVQVNGKLRGQVRVPADADEATVVSAAKADGKAAPYLDGKELRKTVYVPGRLVNFVV
jgi:leucyl-tRNA synthetase